MSDFLSFWHAHTPIFSILIPLFTAVLLLLLGNPGSGELAQDRRQPCDAVSVTFLHLPGLLQPSAILYRPAKAALLFII